MIYFYKRYVSRQYFSRYTSLVEVNQAMYAWSFSQKVFWVVVGGIAIIVTSSRLQVTLRVETCVELELSLPESDLEPSLLIENGE